MQLPVQKTPIVQPGNFKRMARGINIRLKHSFQALVRDILIMPVVVAFCPEKTCTNYPYCNKSVARPRENGIRKWAENCQQCLQAAACSHPGCERKVAPDGRRGSVCWTSHGLCAQHVTDIAYEDRREWSQCKNSKVGCRKLSMKRGGGSCFACSVHMP